MNYNINLSSSPEHWQTVHQLIGWYQPGTKVPREWPMCLNETYIAAWAPAHCLSSWCLWNDRVTSRSVGYSCKFPPELMSSGQPTAATPQPTKACTLQKGTADGDHPKNRLAIVDAPPLGLPLFPCRPGLPSPFVDFSGPGDPCLETEPFPCESPPPKNKLVMGAAAFLNALTGLALLPLLLPLGVSPPARRTQG